MKLLAHKPQTFLQNGNATVEFAAILPIMMLLIFSTAELGRALHNYNTLTKSVRSGARYAAEYVLDGVQQAQIDNALRTKVKNLVVFGAPNDTGAPLLNGFNSDSVSVEIKQGAGYDEPHVQVIANYRFVPLVGNIPGLDSESSLNSGFDMQSAVTMRAL